MAELVVRRLLVDLEQPIPRHWYGGDAFRTALFNALSFSFPFGEQFFIDSVRDGFAKLAPEQQEKLRDPVQGFIGQEATHRRLHALFNAQLEKAGLVNVWEPRSRERFKALEGVDVRHWLGITAANEHLTAIIADFILHTPDLFGEDGPVKTLWLWHAAEEAEHKAVAYDVYRALEDSHEWRVKWMKRATLLLVSECLRQTIANLKRDGTLWKWRTWKSAASFLLGRRGLVRTAYKPWRAYFRPDFHPNQHASTAGVRWLQEHSDRYVPVGTSPT